MSQIGGGKKSTLTKQRFVRHYAGQGSASYTCTEESLEATY